MTDAPTNTPAPLALVRTLEERAFNAWPSRQTVFHRGWLFRLSGGFTQRANSVNALVPGAPFDGVRAAACAVYARHGLPALFRISPLAPPEADAELAEAGYARHDPSLVLHRPLSVVGLAEPHAQVALSASPSDAWLEGFANATGVPRHHRNLHRAMLESIAYPSAFALLHHQGRAVGFALGVVERGALGLYDLAVAADQQGAGHGRALVEALLHWAAHAGATSAYLQVRATNATALRLYEQLGYKTAYSYHYRLPPGA